MKVTYNWIKEFVPINASPVDVAKKLTSAGMEVEEIIYQNEHLHDVVVGKILKIEKHPAADKLVVCQVDIGTKIVQILTAATNVFEGALVPVSLPGADLVNGVKIQPTKMRGVESYGMFCSGQELGIDENYFEGAGVDGILILPNDMKIGEPIDKALSLDDVVFDVNITPNRADCMSVIGIAREVCAIYGVEMRKINLNYSINVYDKDTVHDYVDVEVKTDNCKRYMMAVVKDLKIERSPLWMRARLNAVGIKPINTMVDITNYVLIEMGQPLHAFDQAHISGNKIVVRQAKEGEKIAALNHNSYILDESEMVIANENDPMVIAGVIGGTNSCINDDTKICALESAIFDLKSIRKKKKKIGVRTDSSARYEKGVNVANAEVGLNRALHLVSKIGCGKVVRGIIDKAQAKNDYREIDVSLKLINDILGVEIPQKEAVRILNNLSIETKLYGDKLHLRIPPYREDLENDYDIAEEIIRIYGYDIYDNINYSLFANSKVTEGQHHPRLALERKFRNALVQRGFYENISYSLVSPTSVEKLKLNDIRANLIKIANPITEDISCMRTSLAHSLLTNISYNNSVGNKECAIFECGRIYLTDKLPLTELPLEKNILAIAVNKENFDFYNLKGIVENLLSQTSLKYDIVRSNEPYLHPGISADIISDGKVVGSFGKIHPMVAKNYDLQPNVYYGEIDTGYLAMLEPKKYISKPISKFPIVERDLAVVVDESVTAKEMLDLVKSSCGNLYYDASLFDIYRSNSLGQNKKSMGFKIKLSSLNKTLTDEEVNKVMQKILKTFNYKFGAVLR